MGAFSSFSAFSSRPPAPPAPARPVAAQPVPLAAPQGDPNRLSAFLQTVDLGNGEHAALLSADPANYLSPEGLWQPIDPRFRAEVDGFANRTNVLQVATAARQAVTARPSAPGRDALTG